MLVHDGDGGLGGDGGEGGDGGDGAEAHDMDDGVHCPSFPHCIRNYITCLKVSSQLSTYNGIHLVTSTASVCDHSSHSSVAIMRHCGSLWSCGDCSITC